MSAPFSKIDWFIFTIFGVLLVLALWYSVRAVEDCAASQCPAGAHPRFTYSAGCYCMVRPQRPE